MSGLPAVHCGTTGVSPRTLECSDSRASIMSASVATPRIVSRMEKEHDVTGATVSENPDLLARGSIIPAPVQALPDTLQQPFRDAFPEAGA